MPFIRKSALPIKERRISFCDIETTGRSFVRNEITDITIIIEGEDPWQQYIIPRYFDSENQEKSDNDPTKKLYDAEALGIGHFNLKKWIGLGAKYFYEVADEIIERLHWTQFVICGHNFPQFDLRFIQRHLYECGKDPGLLSSVVIDTMSMAFLAAKNSDKPPNRLGQTAIAKWLGVDVTGTINYNGKKYKLKPHESLSDTLINREIFKKMHQTQRSLF